MDADKRILVVSVVVIVDVVVVVAAAAAATVVIAVVLVVTMMLVVEVIVLGNVTVMLVVEVIMRGNVVVGTDSVVFSSVVGGNDVSSFIEPTDTGTVAAIIGRVDSVVEVPLAVVADVSSSELMLPRAAGLLLVLSAAAEVLGFCVIGIPPLRPVVATMAVVLLGTSIAAIVVRFSEMLELEV